MTRRTVGQLYFFFALYDFGREEIKQTNTDKTEHERSARIKQGPDTKLRKWVGNKKKKMKRNNVNR